MPDHERSQPGPPLSGIRVIDLSALIAGPSCARYLADHGAEVIKIERYPDGDIARYSFTRTSNGRSPMFIQHNAGKKGLCVNLKRPEGITIVQDLVRVSDVMIAAFTPGVMEKLGLGYEALHQVNPRLIMCSVSGFGQSGPNAQRPGYAHISHAMTGWLAMQFLHRQPPEVPRGPGIAVGDVIAGLTAFGAICAALYAREQTGEGEHIDIALFDALFGANDIALQNYLLTGSTEVWYHPVHKTRDGYLTANIGPDFRSWAHICQAMGRPELTTDSRFCDQQTLSAHLQEATSIVTQWLAGLTSEEAEKMLTAHHVACGIVYTVPQATQQPQVQARGLVVDVDDPLYGRIQVVNSGFKYTRAAAGVQAPAPLLGEHHVEVLCHLLGYSAEHLQELQESGVLRAERK